MAVTLNFNAANTLTATVGTGTGSTYSLEIAKKCVSGSWYHIKLIVDPVGNTFTPALDIYFGNKIIAKGCYLRAAVSQVSATYFEKSTTNTGDLYLDNFKVYQVQYADK